MLSLPLGVETIRSLSLFLETTGKIARHMALLSLWNANSSRKRFAENPRAVSGFAGRTETFDPLGKRMVFWLLWTFGKGVPWFALL